MLTLILIVAAIVVLVTVTAKIVHSLEEHAEQQRARRNAAIRTGKWKAAGESRDRHLR